ncbi:hypothetical protein GTA08_BOTSDO11900 [Botryosphaeria dothidea]|uniref:Uncharacterized protein n=1 Tax=Botryosphaeria dothidea TaxID=55169 RepID=A0A8H4NA07_9PEZI|nr:hypothetical protein GTA08_BOTSDO11900 [Botryosphaeria dothidea]
MATLLSLPAEIRQTILLLCLPDEVNISKPWPRHIRSLAHICTLVRLDMRWPPGPLPPPPPPPAKRPVVHNSARFHPDRAAYAHDDLLAGWRAAVPLLSQNAAARLLLLDATPAPLFALDKPWLPHFVRDRRAATFLLEHVDGVADVVLGGGGFELDARGVVFVGPGVVERVRVREEGRAVGLRGAVGRVVRVGAGATVGGEEAERLGAVVEEVKWGGDAERAFGEVVQVEGEGVAAGDLGCAVELNLGGGKGLGEARREFLGLAARDLGLRIESVGEGPRRWVRLIQDLEREKVAGEEEFDRET